MTTNGSLAYIHVYIHKLKPVAFCAKEMLCCRPRMSVLDVISKAPRWHRAVLVLNIEWMTLAVVDPLKKSVDYMPCTIVRNAKWKNWHGAVTHR